MNYSILKQLAFLLIGAAVATAGTPTTKEYRVLPPVIKGNLSIFPVVGGPDYATAQLLTLDEGLRNGTVVVTEAGHATLPATSDREAEVIAELRRRFGHVYIERVLSGSGLENLYQALAAFEGATAPARDAAAITEAAFDGSSPLCRATVDTFCAFLGGVAGNLALTFLARGGVFIAGGIVPRFADRLAETQFRTQFESKGRYEELLRQIPTSVIVTPDTSFIGLKTFVERKLQAAG